MGLLAGEPAADYSPTLSASARAIQASFSSGDSSEYMAEVYCTRTADQASVRHFTPHHVHEQVSSTHLGELTKAHSRILGLEGLAHGVLIEQVRRHVAPGGARISRNFRLGHDDDELCVWALQSNGKRGNVSKSWAMWIVCMVRMKAQHRRHWQ